MKTDEAVRKNGSSAKSTKSSATVPKRVTKKSVAPAPSPAENSSVSLLEQDVIPELASETAVVLEYSNDVDRIRARHTLRLEQIYRKAIAGHAQSCEDERTEKRTAQGDGATSGDGDAAPTSKRADASKYKVESTRKGRAGDIRYLTEARSALSEIRRIWGIDSAPSAKDRMAESLSRLAFEAASDDDLAILNGAFQTLQKLSEQGEVESRVLSPKSRVEAISSM